MVVQNKKYTKKLLLRWSIGDYDSITKTNMSDEKYYYFVRMAKFSVYSFQKFFDANFLIGFNGEDIDRFDRMWNDVKIKLIRPVSFFYQRKVKNPYPTFFPLGGVWWKWVPFRYDVAATEISIDTDIICISEPKSWYDWIENDVPLLIPQEAISEVCEATCGDVWKHMTIKGKRALNCGIIGQKKGVDVSEQFFKLTELVDYGTFNGNFITEQGLFNILYRSLENEGIEHYELPYEQNLQAKHMYTSFAQGKEVETIHFTAKSKLIFNELYAIMRDRVDQNKSNVDFLSALVEWYSLNSDRLKD